MPWRCPPASAGSASSATEGARGWPLSGRDGGQGERGIWTRPQDLRHPSPEVSFCVTGSQQSACGQFCKTNVRPGAGEGLGGPVSAKDEQDAPRLTSSHAAQGQRRPRASAGSAQPTPGLQRQFSEELAQRAEPEGPCLPLPPNPPPATCPPMKGGRDPPRTQPQGPVKHPGYPPERGQRTPKAPRAPVPSAACPAAGHLSAGSPPC